MNQSDCWNRQNKIFLFLVIGIGIFLRFYGLDDRPLHHDESLHGIYSLYYLENSAKGFYKYNPLLHGPLLYHTLPWSLWLLGIGKFALRIPSALLGTLLLLLPLIFSRKLSKYTVLSMTTIIALSPTMIYWSRFIRHDNFIFAAIVLLLFACLKTRGPIRLILIAISVALQFSAKENTYVHLIFFISFLFYELLLSLSLKLSKETLLKAVLNYLKRHPVAAIFSILIFAGIFAHFYSAGFVYPEGILDGAYRKSLFYWFDQHQKERITGPFSYPFLINTFFESWWVPALVAHIYFFYKNESSFLRIAFLLSLGISATCHLIFKDPFAIPFFADTLRIKRPLDYYLFFPTIVHSIILTSSYIIKERRDLALSGFFFFSSLFTYSYLGEKVPWLAMYPLVSGIIFYSLFFDKLFQKPILIIFIPLLLFNLKTTIWTNFTNSHHEENLLTQVHTAREFEDAMFESRRELDQSKEAKYFLVKDSYAWPTTWYLHGAKGYRFSLSGKELNNYHYVLAKPEDSKVNTLLVKSHIKKVIPLRKWWLPRYHEMSFKSVWDYTIFKKPWNEVGANDVALWTLRSNQSIIKK